MNWGWLIFLCLLVIQSAEPVNDDSVLQDVNDHFSWLWKHLLPSPQYQDANDFLSQESEAQRASVQEAIDVAVSEFPTDDWVAFLSAYLNPQKGGSSQLINTRTIQLTAALAACAKNDGRCATTLGDFYMKRMLSRTIRRGIEGDLLRGNHLQRAVQLWWHGANLADREALYRLAVFYASFPNSPVPPTLQSGGQDALDISQHQEADGTSTGLQSVFVSGNDEAFERMDLTLRVLDLPESDPDSHAAESELVAWYLRSKLNTAAANGVSRRWPMYKRDSLAILFLYAAAHEGHVGANLALGYRHLYGIGVPRRCFTAAAYYTRVAAAAQATTTYGIPTAAELVRLNLPPSELFAASASARNTIAAFQLHLAEQESPVMETAVGRKFLLGSEGFPKDPFTAAKYFLSAAAKNEARATAFLGYMSAMGLGLSTNYTLAEALFRSAIALSGETPEDADPMALNGLGWLYFTGHIHTGSNMPLAVQYFNASAAQGFSDAQYNLGSLYLTGEGLKKSIPTASQYLMKAVEQGHTSAAYLLGLLHVNGLGVVKDCFLGTTLLKRAAERHSWVAEMGRQAYLLQSAQQWDSAVFDYWLLAEAGVEVAQANIGALLDGGGNRPVLSDDRNGLAAQIQRLFGRRALRPPFSTGRAALAIIRRAIPWLAGGTLIHPVGLFTPSGLRPSGPVNRFFAQRYWTMAAQQRSTSAKARVGDYAWYGWGTEQALQSAGMPSYTTSELSVLTGCCDEVLPHVSNPPKSINIEEPRYTVETLAEEKPEPGEALHLVEFTSKSVTVDYTQEHADQTGLREHPQRNKDTVDLLHFWVAPQDIASQIANQAIFFYKRRKPDYSLAYAIYSSIASLPTDQNELLSPVVTSSLSITAARTHAAMGYIAQYGLLIGSKPSLSVASHHYSRIATRNSTLVSVSVLLSLVMHAVAVYDLISQYGLLSLLSSDYRMCQLSLCVAFTATMVLLRSLLRKRYF